MIIHAAVIVSLLTLVGGRALADERWYIGHFGQEICVPLNDIGNNGTRLYYGAGNMRRLCSFYGIRRYQNALGSDHARRCAPLCDQNT
jgi:hypothetical protein